MSLVMAYFLFLMIFIYKQECAVIRLDRHNQNGLQYVIQKYMNPLRRLSADLPNHAVEMEIEIHGSVPRKVTNDARRSVRHKNPRRPKPILRAQDEPVGGEVTANGTATTANTTDPEQAAPAPAAGAAGAGAVSGQGAPAAGAAGAGAVSGQGAPAPDVRQEQPDPQKIPVFMEDLKKALDDLEKKLISNPENLAAVTKNAQQSDPQKIPVFMEDLKKALDDLEKKLIPNPENSAAAKPCSQNPNPGAAAPQPSGQPVSIDDIVQLLKKGIHVQHRMPHAGDEKLEWVQIKIPKSMQL